MSTKDKKRVEAKLGRIDSLLHPEDQNAEHVTLHDDKHISSASVVQRVHSKMNTTGLAGMAGNEETAQLQSILNHSAEYKFRKIGDRKIIGFIKYNDSRPPLTVEGWLNRSDFKKAALKMKSSKKNSKRDKRTFQCTLIAPENEVSSLEMRIKWTHTRKRNVSGASGTIKLFKLDGLRDEDVDLPTSEYVGLSRHEFYDALLCIARIRNNSNDGDHGDDGNDGDDDKRFHDHDHQMPPPLFLVFDELVSNTLDLYVYRGMVELRRYIKGKDIENHIRDRLQGDRALNRLFHKYLESQTEEVHRMEEDTWIALAEDLFAEATAMNRKVWKQGGKPEWDQLTRCFTLCKTKESMDEEGIDFAAFLRCLVYLTDAIYSARPDAKYELMPFEEKLDLVLKWCHKKDVLVSNMRTFHSGSLKSVKKRKQSFKDIKKTLSAQSQSDAAESVPSSADDDDSDE